MRGRTAPLTFVVVACAVLVLGAGCSSTSPDLLENIGIDTGVGGVEASMKWPSFSEADEAKMATENAAKFEAQAKMWSDPVLETYVTDTGQRIVAVAKPRPFPYRFRIIADPGVNAFTFGGGLVYVNACLLARMDNEAKVAMVLPHEIGHVTGRHVPKDLEAQYRELELAYYRKGDRTNAATTLERHLTLAPSAPDAVQINRRSPILSADGNRGERHG